jgi:uncharacterized FlaG/YvyC family protein
MANEISSQITSTVLKQSRPTEQPRKLEAVAEGVSNRQDVAAGLAAQSGNSVIQGEGIPTKGQLEEAVSDINAYVQTVNREVQFRVDEALPLGRAIVTVINADTEETIREFPSEEALALAHRLKDQKLEEAQSQVVGLIISAQA